MEREVGGGIGLGNTCKPMAVLFQCITKSTTNKKNKIKKIKKIKMSQCVFSDCFYNPSLCREFIISYTKM